MRWEENREQQQNIDVNSKEQITQRDKNWERKEKTKKRLPQPWPTSPLTTGTTKGKQQ